MEGSSPQTSALPADSRPNASDAPIPSPKARHPLSALGRRLATFAIAAAALLTALLTWQSYVLSPWTRNGVVRVQVASIAPQVSGQIVDIRVVDNQFVRKGDVLYVIDKFDFGVAMLTAKATLEQRAADLELKKVEAERRQRLSDLATTPEEQQTYASAAAQSKAAFDAAQQQLAQAELNLKRTTVVSPVNGYVTNLLLRVGDFAALGARNMSIVDSDSFWIDGYFEETKMGRICIGDRAEAKLMGYADPIIGRAETITRGISVANSAAGAQGLPNVDPIYTWVRLAQRVPVRIAIERVPSGITLVSGMTATITMQPATSKNSTLLSGISERLSDLFRGAPVPSPSCLRASAVVAPSESLQVPNEPAPLSSQQLQPDVAPGMTLPPRTETPAPLVDPPASRPHHQDRPARH